MIDSRLKGQESRDAGPPLPAPLRTDGSNAFAHHSMAVRVPNIIRETVDRNPDYPPAVREALLRLCDEIAGDAPLRLFAAPAPDHDQWSSHFQTHRGETWLGTEWFFAEMLAYRLMLEAGQYWMTLRDPFAPFKQEELASVTLWEALAAALETSGTPGELLAALLTFALWGNRIDLSLKQTAALGTGARDEHQLANDVPRVVDHLLGNPPGDVHMIMDNAGTEQALDLVLIDFLLSEGIADTMTLHVKMQPVLVSDAIVADFQTLVGCMVRRGGKEAALAARLLTWLGSRRLAIVPDFFWSTAGRLWELPPRLDVPMQGARLVIAKGDINYRRATNDALWPPGARLDTPVRDFPAPLLLLRTLKSDTLIGVDAEQQNRLDASPDSDWRTSGAYGVAQFAP